MTYRNYILLFMTFSVGCGPKGGFSVGDTDAGTDLAMSGTVDAATANPEDLAVLVDLAVLPSDLAVAKDLAMKDAPPMGDAGLSLLCMSPLPITFSNNKAKVVGDTSLAGNTTSSGECGGTTGPDLVYTFTLNSPQNLTAQVTPGDQKFNPVLYLRKVCDGDGTELACDEKGAGMPALVDLVLQPGSYFLWVDGYFGTKGPFTLDLTLAAPPAAPANGTCQTAETLVFTNGGATVKGDLRNAKDGALGSCGKAGGGDAVYSFTTNKTYTLVVDVKADPSTPNYRPVVYVRKVCQSGQMADELACDDASFSKSVSVEVSILPAGTYWIWVDSLNAGGKFDLTVTLKDPPPIVGKCMNAPALSFANNVATVNVDTTVAMNDTDSANCSGSGKDLLYKFTTNAPQSVTVKLVPNQATPMYAPTVALRSVCESELWKDELVCNEADKGMTATAIVPNVLAGTYFVLVDGALSSSGKGVLTVTLAAPIPPPMNDNCSMPKALTLGSPMAGDTTFATDDLAGAISLACDVNQTQNFPGRDLVYSFTANVAATMTATLVSDGSWDPTLWMASGTCVANGSNCVQASDKVGNNEMEKINFVAAAGTTYYFVVDAYDLTEHGPFTLTLN